MVTATYIESDVEKGSSLSRHFQPEENDAESDAFKDRIDSLVGPKQTRAFARKAGISESVLRQYIKGESQPTLDKLLAIARTANVNLLWLATGEGPKRPEARDGPCASAGYVEVETLRKAVEAVELMGKAAPAERKALAIARVYERLVRAQGQAEMIETMRLIQTILEEKAGGNVDS